MGYEHREKKVKNESNKSGLRAGRFKEVRRKHRRRYHFGRKISRRTVGLAQGNFEFPANILNRSLGDIKFRVTSVETVLEATEGMRAQKESTKWEQRREKKRNFVVENIPWHPEPQYSWNSEGKKKVCVFWSINLCSKVHPQNLAYTMNFNKSVQLSHHHQNERLELFPFLYKFLHSL